MDAFENFFYHSFLASYLKFWLKRPNPKVQPTWFFTVKNYGILKSWKKWANGAMTDVMSCEVSCKYQIIQIRPLKDAWKVLWGRGVRSSLRWELLRDSDEVSTLDVIPE